MDVLDIVKAKLIPADIPGDLLIVMHIAEISQSIKNYTNRTDIPSDLYFVLANMVVDLIKGEKRKEDPEAAASVASIKEGDVTVQFGAAKVASSERSMENLIYDYRAQLNKFRKLKW